MWIVGIAGGSGAGKSTVCYSLLDKYPGIFEVLNLDDYQKLKTDQNLPRISGMINWDHPDVIRWDDLTNDLQKLKQGHQVTIDSWSHRSNPDYHVHGNMLKRTIKPAPVLLLEGYLVLYKKEVRNILDMSFYLDLDQETRNKRRGKAFLTGRGDYETKVLIPMHNKYVEPTKKHATKVLDASKLNVNQIKESIYKDLSVSD